MNATINKIVKMIQSEDDGLKCSAIRVLGEFGIKEKKLITALGQKLSSESETVKLAILDSFIKNPQTATLSYLLPLLKAEGNVRRKAIHAIGAIGPKAVSILDNEFKTVSLQEKKLFVDILSTVRSKPTIDFLVNSLVGGDLELLKYVCFSLRAQIERMQKAEKIYLLERVSKFLSREDVKKNDEMTTSGILLLGFIAEPQGKKTLLGFLDKKRSFYVRKNALLSLTRSNLTGSGNEDVAAEVFPLLDDPDFPNIVRNALTILEKITLPKKYFSQLTKVLDTTRHPAVKRFVLTRLAQDGSLATIKLLVKHLDSNDPMIRDTAAEALGKLPKAVPDLLKKLELTREFERAEKICLILRAHKDLFKKEKSRALYLKLEKGLNKQDEQAKVYALLLKQVNPDLFYEETLKKAKQFKRVKKYEQAKKYLELLSSGLFYTDGVRYEMASVLLKLSRKDLNPQLRASDGCLNLFSGLARANLTSVIKAIKADRVLDANDLYYVGFHFAEKQFEQKAFGVDVLKMMLRKYPRAKMKTAAKQKLKFAAQGTPQNGEAPLSSPQALVTNAFSGGARG